MEIRMDVDVKKASSDRMHVDVHNTQAATGGVL